MKMDTFVPETDNQHKFAIAVPTESGIMMMIQKYKTKKELETGYREWLDYASRRNLTKPYPIEILNERLECKILNELLD